MLGTPEEVITTLVNGIAVGEEQFARGDYKTLEEARTILDRRKLPDSEYLRYQIF